MSDNENEYHGTPFEVREDVEREGSAPVPAWNPVESPKLVIDKLNKWKKGIQDKKKQKIANTQKFQEMMKQQIQDEEKYNIQKQLKRQQQRRGVLVTIKPKIPNRKLLITPTKEGFNSFELDVHYMQAENEYKKNVIKTIIQKLNLDLERKEDRIKFIRYIFKCVKDINKLLPTSEEDPVEENWIHKWKEAKGKKIISKPIGRVYFRTIQDMYKRVSDITNQYINIIKHIDPPYLETGDTILSEYLSGPELIKDLDFIFTNQSDQNIVATAFVNFLGAHDDDMKKNYELMLITLYDFIIKVVYDEISDFYLVLNEEFIKQIVERLITYTNSPSNTPKIIETELNKMVNEELLIKKQTSKPYYLTPEYTGLVILNNGKIKNNIPNNGSFSFNNSIEYWTPINYYFDGEPVNLDNIHVGDNNKVYLKPSYYYESEVKKEYERYFYDFYDYLKAWEMTYQEQGNIQKVQDIQNYFVEEFEILNKLLGPIPEPDDENKLKNDIIKLTNYIHFTIPDEKRYNRFPVPGYKK